VPVDARRDHLDEQLRARRRRRRGHPTTRGTGPPGPATSRTPAWSGSPGGDQRCLPDVLRPLDEVDHEDREVGARQRRAARAR
jgi:hypothetical protein